MDEPHRSRHLFTATGNIDSSRWINMRRMHDRASLQHRPSTRFSQRAETTTSGKEVKSQVDEFVFPDGKR